MEYDLLPEHMINNMIAYVEGKEMLCGFLSAVFANDLFNACALGDSENLKLLPIYVSYICNKLPVCCHGSYATVANWKKNKVKTCQQEKELDTSGLVQ